MPDKSDDNEIGKEEPTSNQDVIPAKEWDDDAIDSALSQIPEEKLADFIARNIDDDPTMIAEYSSWRAPLPPADVLEHYEKICPGFADRIMTSTEKEQDHRHDLEKIAVGASIQSHTRGQWMAFGSAVIMIGATAYLIVDGHNLAGTIFGGFTITWLVGVFLTGRPIPWRKEKDSETAQEDEPASEEE